MKRIYDGDRLVNKIIGAKNTPPAGQYRWSCYTIPHEFEGSMYLFNNFTKRFYVLEGEELDFSAEKRFTADEINADGVLKTLYTDHFIVSEDYDETAAYIGYCNIARALKFKKEGYDGFTILPTTACNARCIYCYEQGIEYVTMTEDTIDAVIEFIKKVRNPNKSVFFSWFGGEPLIGEKYIDKICAAMREEGIEYASRITTNGSLITRENVKKMVDDWKVRHMQITLDGVEEEYNRRKNYYFNYESAYWHVLSRIKLINESGISLSIRVNVDNGNIDGVPQMLDDLAAFITDRERLTIDLAPLFDLQASDDSQEIWEKVFDIYDIIEENGFYSTTRYSLTQARINFCMADRPYRSIVIAPDGKLYNCENIMSFDSVGDIWSGITNTDYLNGLAKVEPAREMCKGCFSLPECTTFTRCGHVRVNCKYSYRKSLERTLDIMLPRIIEKKLTEAEDDENSINDNVNC